MTFTTISILLCAFEYGLSKQIHEHETAMIFKFTLESQMVANIPDKQFSKIFIYANKRAITHLVCKTLFLNKKQVEKLIPMQSVDGVEFRFIVVADEIHFERVWKEMTSAVQNEMFIAKLKAIYNITDQCDIPLNTLRKWTLTDNHDKMDIDSNRKTQLVSFMTIGSLSNLTTDDHGGNCYHRL